MHYSLVIYLTVVPCFSSFFFLHLTVVEVVVIVVDVLETAVVTPIYVVSVDTLGLECSHNPLLFFLLSTDC